MRRNFGAIAAALILVIMGTSLASCGDDEDKGSSPPKGESETSKGQDLVLAEALTDMEKFIPRDLNGQLESDGLAFRVRSIECAPEEATFTATCVVLGDEGRTYAVNVKVKRSDGSYVYDCPKCP